jgi:hypothetical protein
MAGLAKLAKDYYKGVYNPGIGQGLSAGEDATFDEEVRMMNGVRSDMESLRSEQYKDVLPIAAGASVLGTMVAPRGYKLNGASWGLAAGSVGSLLKGDVKERRNSLIESANKLKAMERRHHEDHFTGEHGGQYDKK